MSDLKETTPLFGSNTTFVEELYECYLQNPQSVEEGWRNIFAAFKGDTVKVAAQNRLGASWAPRKSQVMGIKEAVGHKPVLKQEGINEKACRDSINALMLIRAFKVRGNLLSDLDPLGLEIRGTHPDLDPETYGFSKEDYDHPVYLGGALGMEYATLRELQAVLKRTYSGRIGVEFMHIPSLEQRDWISEKIETYKGRPDFSTEEKKSILLDLIKVELFEQFVHIKYPGAKRFSAEGGETFIAAMEKAIETSARLGVKEIVVGMAHRGRLNVLTKVMGRRYAAILSEFQGNQAAFSEDLDASGDVKYHQGTSSDRDFDGHQVHMSLTANPSHLEAVNPVVSGRVRAKQDQLNDTDRRKAMGILIHGDAAFSGQGVVAETLAFSDLTGYTTGGTVHIVINNQIGFTTSPKYSRSSPYPTDIAKGIHAPIFHVNGDDPEAVVFVSKLAVEFRQRFKKDVVVDVFCYRRYGHNEGDEPSFTQPLMYKAISNHLTPMGAYAKVLIDEATVTKQEYEGMKKKFHDFLEQEYKASLNYTPDEADWLEGFWKGFIKPEKGVKPAVDTGVDLKLLKQIGYALASYPKGFRVHRKLERLMEAKKEMLEKGADIDWAMGEALAFGSLLVEGHPVRLSGQDSVRGTFSHRHSALIDQETEERYFPLNHLSPKQAFYEGLDSNLSEFAVLGFEYGYSLTDPHSLVLWEAQFGDFSNGAQVIIDQFISSSEMKWLRCSGLVMLLPHGYEGQGPEHSSARLERYLQLCGDDNMQVANCTTPASFFHLLRRQLHRNFRKPLVVMTPKSLLRHKLCVSSLQEFAPGTQFQLVLPEVDKAIKKEKVRKVVLCSGKVYYDLLEERIARKIKDIALVRIEQYYPFPAGGLAKILRSYKKAEIIWCQEEPENMGAWHFLDRKIEEVLVGEKMAYTRPRYVGRQAAAASAAGYPKIFKRQQQELINEALS